MSRWVAKARSPARRRRGQAMVELALVLPLFVMLILFSLYLTELVRAKLKVQEAARFAAWELTSHPVDDLAKARHREAFDLAREQVVTQTVARYSDLDSAGAFNREGPFVGVDAFALELSSQQSPEPATDIPFGSSADAFMGSIAATFAGKASGWILEEAGFNREGWVTADASVTLLNRILPRSYLQRSEGGFFEISPVTPPGSVNLDVLTLRHRMSLIASDWHLSDGADAVMSKGRAGRHQGEARGAHGLYAQTRRLRRVGFELPDSVSNLFAGQLGFLGLPEPLGTFVVSRNYRERDAAGERVSACRHIPGYPETARNGLSSFAEPAGPGLDADSTWCYDTAPFRDRQEYQSQYAQIFQARGPYFMGCPNAQADNPAAAVDTSVGDLANKTPCGSAAP